MAEILQQKLGVKIEFILGHNELRIDMEGSDGNFYAQLDEIRLNPKIVNLQNLEIKKNGVKMNFNAPVICNINNIDETKSMMAGVKFEGLDKDAFIKKIEETARNFGPQWEAAVLRRTDEIDHRKINNK